MVDWAGQLRLRLRQMTARNTLLSRHCVYWRLFLYERDRLRNSLIKLIVDVLYDFSQSVLHTFWVHQHGGLLHYFPLVVEIESRFASRIVLLGWLLG
jgi:hypothetical protein